MRFVPKAILTNTYRAGIVLSGLLVPGISIAAPNEPPPPSPGPVPPGLPIDNGIVILLILATTLGVYKIHQTRKNKKAPM